METSGQSSHVIHGSKVERSRAREVIHDREPAPAKSETPKSRDD